MDKSILPGQDEMETVWVSETVMGSSAYGWNAAILFDSLDFAKSARKDVMDFKRSFEQTPKGFTLTDVIVVKEKRIPVEEIKSAGFSSLKNEIRSCFKRVGLVFDEGNN